METRYKGWNGTIVGDFENFEGTINDFQKLLDNLGQEVPEMAGNICSENYNRHTGRHILVIGEEEIADEIV